MRRRRIVANGEARELMAQVIGILRRERKYVARVNFMCCSSCAGYDLAQSAAKIVSKGRAVLGCAFWHKQDEAAYWESGRLAIRYGVLGSQEVGDIGKPTLEQGQEIVALIHKLAEETGRRVEVEWDGDPDKVIWVWDAHVIETRRAREREREARERAREMEATRFLGEGI